MIKNLLAAIGLAVVSQKGYEFYREYTALKHEKERGGEQHLKTPSVVSE